MECEGVDCGWVCWELLQVEGEVEADIGDDRPDRNERVADVLHFASPE